MKKSLRICLLYDIINLNILILKIGEGFIWIMNNINDNKSFFTIFLLISFALLISGAVMTPSLHILLNESFSIVEHYFIINKDYFQIVDVGSTFFKSGILIIFVLISYYISKVKINGSHIASVMMVLGFSFFGKNIYNVWPLFFGVVLFAKLKKRKISDVINLAWFSTALSPIVSSLAFDTPVLKPGSFIAIIVAILFGVISGYLVAIFAEHGHKLHQNLTLYNAGFVGGLVALTINSFLKAIGLSKNNYTQGEYLVNENFKLAIVLFSIFLILFVSGFILNRGLKGYKALLNKRCKSLDFVDNYGIGLTFINMAVLGTITSCYVLIVGGHLNGVIYAAIFTVTGFAAFGMTFIGIIPIIFGTFAMSFITGGISSIFLPSGIIASALKNVSSNNMLTAAIFGCGLSPFVAHFGIAAGIISGAFNSILLPNVSILYGFMSLYNNGFSTGLTSIILLPLFENFYKKLNKIN